jgi:putative Mg2+ transporter-C (MgtC) family protein
MRPADIGFALSEWALAVWEGAMVSEVLDILLRLLAAGLLGACIGFERRVHHKAIGIAGMMLIAIGSATYMLLGRHLAEVDPSSISRTLQGFLGGIGFLGGAVIFKSGFDVKGIKAAAAVWITGAMGLAVATSYWWLGITVGVVTAAVMFVADSFPDEVREEKQEQAPEADPR